MSKYHLYYLPATNEFTEDWVIHAENTDYLQLLGGINPKEDFIRQRALCADQSSWDTAIEEWHKFLFGRVNEYPQLILVDVNLEEIINYINCYNLVSN